MSLHWRSPLFLFHPFQFRSRFCSLAVGKYLGLPPDLGRHVSTGLWFSRISLFCFYFSLVHSILLLVVASARFLFRIFTVYLWCLLRRKTAIPDPRLFGSCPYNFSLSFRLWFLLQLSLSFGSSVSSFCWLRFFVLTFSRQLSSGMAVR